MALKVKVLELEQALMRSQHAHIRERESLTEQLQAERLQRQAQEARDTSLHQIEIEQLRARSSVELAREQATRIRYQREAEQLTEEVELWRAGDHAGLRKLFTQRFDDAQSLVDDTAQQIQTLETKLIENAGDEQASKRLKRRFQAILEQKKRVHAQLEEARDVLATLG